MRYLGAAFGVALATAILLILPGDQGPFVAFLLGFSLGGFGGLFGRIVEGAL